MSGPPVLHRIGARGRVGWSGTSDMVKSAETASEAKGSARQTIAS
jgi:hypothetical protein